MKMRSYIKVEIISHESLKVPLVRMLSEHLIAAPEVSIALEKPHQYKGFADIKFEISTPIASG
jgi:hypothetical protein